MTQNTKQEDPHVWRFVEQYYPDYDHSNEIAHSDDLQKLVDNEINGAAEDLLKEEYGGDPENPQIQIDYDRVHREIYEKAIQNFLKTREQKHYYLFGQDITKEYFDGDFKSVIEMAKSNEYDCSVFAWNPSDGPGVLLDAADGWMGTADITEEEYNELSKIKKD